MNPQISSSTMEGIHLCRHGEAGVNPLGFWSLGQWSMSPDRLYDVASGRKRGAKIVGCWGQRHDGYETCSHPGPDKNLDRANHYRAMTPLALVCDATTRV